MMSRLVHRGDLHQHLCVQLPDPGERGENTHTHTQSVDCLETFCEKRCHGDPGHSDIITLLRSARPAAADFLSAGGF